MMFIDPISVSLFYLLTFPKHVHGLRCFIGSLEESDPFTSHECTSANKFCYSAYCSNSLSVGDEENDYQTFILNTRELQLLQFPNTKFFDKSTNEHMAMKYCLQYGFLTNVFIAATFVKNCATTETICAHMDFGCASAGRLSNSSDFKHHCYMCAGDNCNENNATVPTTHNLSHGFT
jgi:hypothetical protein